MLKNAEIIKKMRYYGGEKRKMNDDKNKMQKQGCDDLFL